MDRKSVIEGFEATLKKLKSSKAKEINGSLIIKETDWSAEWYHEY